MDLTRHTYFPSGDGHKESQIKKFDKAFEISFLHTPHRLDNCPNVLYISHINQITKS